MDQDDQSTDNQFGANQEDYSTGSNVDLSSHDTMFFDASSSPVEDEGVSVDPNFKRPDSITSSDIPSPSLSHSEQGQNSLRIILAIGSLLLFLGIGVGAMYMTKTGFFKDNSISAGNHSFVIDESKWEINEIDKENNLITLIGKNEKVMVSISDIPELSNYPYDDPSTKQYLGLIGKVNTSKKNYGDIRCAVYDTSTKTKGETVHMNVSICNIQDNTNVMIGIISNQDNLEQYFNEGINILKTAKK